MYSPGTHGHDSLVPAWPKAAPGLPRHFALSANILRYIGRGLALAQSTIAGPYYGAILANPQGLSSPGPHDMYSQSSQGAWTAVQGSRQMHYQ